MSFSFWAHCLSISEKESQIQNTGDVEGCLQATLFCPCVCDGMVLGATTRNGILGVSNIEAALSSTRLPEVLGVVTGEVSGVAILAAHS